METLEILIARHVRQPAWLEVEAENLTDVEARAQELVDETEDDEQEWKTMVQAAAWRSIGRNPAGLLCIL